MGKRIKISLTIDEAIVAAIDEEAARGSRSNRSEVVERALRSWIRLRSRGELDRQIEAYYRGLSAAEIEEDEAWAGLGDEAVARLWDRS